MKISAEGPVKGGMVPVTDLLANLFQGYAFPDQLLGYLHPALGYKIMKCDGCFFLKQLGHSGNTDTAVGRNRLQRQLFCQIGIYISRNLIQKGILSLDSAWAFLTLL